MRAKNTLGLILMLLFSTVLTAQNQFDPAVYQDFLKDIEQLDSRGLQEMHPLKSQYVQSYDQNFDITDYNYLDSIIIKMNLTDGELNLLEQNQFFVTERLSYVSYGDALWNIYSRDLPVMITTDMILHAMHKSYDEILKVLEIKLMRPNLQTFLQSLYDNYPNFKDAHSGSPAILKSLKDVDLYVTVGLSLIEDKTMSSQFDHQQEVDRVLQLIKNENFTSTNLFSDSTLDLDFSQYKPRGHYTESEELEQYFRTMMWLGRGSFYLTPPPLKEFSLDEKKRINSSAFLLNQFIESSNEKHLLDQNDKIINKLIGESDNITADEYSLLLDKLGIHKVDDLLNNFENYYNALENDPDFKSRIASFPYFTDPNSEEPEELPITYKLSGQRFIIDSYIFSNLVHDRVKFRLLPDPLDALICLGNNDAIDLMQDEIEEHNYAKNLASLRYLVDHQEKEYWTEGFYGTWLDAIRSLGQDQDWDEERVPPFMKTTAWQQEKMNTQLAAWTQLRHDNLLYAAQSYTGGIGCCFPHSYVEPYPAFYERVAKFSTEARTFFETADIDVNVDRIISYYNSFENVIGQLQTLAEKELNKEPFTEEEEMFLKTMMNDAAVCGIALTGWITDLYYNKDIDLLDPDFITADVHTQTTDLAGNIVGNVLQVANGGIDLGVFLAPSPSNDYKMTAFVGPVSSYYEFVNPNFERSTDEDWTTTMLEDELPERPDWVNIYLAKDDGEQRVEGREISGTIVAGLENKPAEIKWQVFPNPTKDFVQIVLPSSVNSSEAFVIITDHLGKEIKTYNFATIPNQTNIQTFKLDFLNRGIYNFTILVDGKQSTKQVILVE